MFKPHKLYHRCTSNQRRFLPRNQTGNQIVEYAVALWLLIGVAFIPFFDLVIVPIRWMLAQEVINTYIRRLSMCESFSESLREIEADPSLQAQLLHLGGIDIKTINLHLKITRIASPKNESIEVTEPGSIPPSWLPEGAMAPCEYSLKMNIEAGIAPAILMKLKGMTVLGLTAPIPVTFTVLHEWPNLGRDPATKNYFINE